MNEKCRNEMEFSKRSPLGLEVTDTNNEFIGMEGSTALPEPSTVVNRPSHTAHFPLIYVDKMNT